MQKQKVSAFFYEKFSYHPKNFDVNCELYIKTKFRRDFYEQSASQNYGFADCKPYDSYVNGCCVGANR